MKQLRDISLFWVAVIAAFAGFLWLFQGILTPFILGLAIAYLLNPMVVRVQAVGTPRWAAVLILLISFLLIVGLMIGLLVPVLVREASQLITELPAWIDAGQARLAAFSLRMGLDIHVPNTESIVAGVQDQAGRILQAGKGLLVGVVAGGAAVASFVSFLFLMPIVAFYMMLDWPRLVAKIDALVPRSRAATFHQLMREIDRTLAGFIRGQLTVCLFLGLFYGIGLSLLGLKFGFVIGMCAGLLSIMPYVGSGIGLVISVLVAWFTTNQWSEVVGVLAVFGIGQFIESNFLTPRLVGNNIGLHPLWVIFALMAGGSLFGFVGLLVAVPVAAVIGVMVRFFIGEYQKSPYYTG